MDVDLPLINSYTNWGQLEEVWLGDVYPASWYDDFPSDVRDVFYHLTELTQQDLDYISRALQQQGITVCRPVYDRREDFLVNDQLTKPQICPRDRFAVIGQTLYQGLEDCLPNPWHIHLGRYRANDPNSVQDIPYLGDSVASINGANIVRAGRDLYLDIVTRSVDKPHIENQLLENLPEIMANYRVHVLRNGGHVDACFSALRPGLLITTKYYTDYARTFPGWHKINVLEPEFRRYGYQHQRGNGNWAVPGMPDSVPAFNHHVLQHARDWVGNYTETFFEVNCLVINEHTVFMLGENEAVARELERWGMTVHWMPFRARTFWDGGLHCITLDIRRKDQPTDLFPDRAKSFYCQF